MLFSGDPFVPQQLEQGVAVACTAWVGQVLRTLPTHCSCPEQLRMKCKNLSTSRAMIYTSCGLHKLLGRHKSYNEVPLLPDLYSSWEPPRVFSFQMLPKSKSIVCVTWQNSTVLRNSDSKNQTTDIFTPPCRRRDTFSSAKRAYCDKVASCGPSFKNSRLQISYLSPWQRELIKHNREQ